MAIQYESAPIAGWFVLDVLRKETRKPDWVMLMIDIDPDDFANDPWRKAQSKWVPVPGKYKSQEAAWEAAEALIATRH